MRIVFMGTPEFAIPVLTKLIESEHSVAAVISAPDKERGRGKQISFTPVKEFAIKNKLPVFTPVSLRDNEFLASMKSFEPDLFVVVAFRILPKELYTIPKYGSINLHGSLLPKFRGAAPIQWALINGEKETGVTTFFLEDKVDTGNIILQSKIGIDEEDDFGSLHDKLKNLGADLVLETVNLIEQSKAVTSLQDNSIASPAPKITKEICEINWNKNAVEIHNLIKGLAPYPGAFFVTEGKKFKIFKTNIVVDHSKFENQEWKTIPLSLNQIHSSTLSIIQNKKEIYVKTGDRILRILELQPEGRKRMTAEEFLRGHSFLK
jgi:methionyl-tRNA formyltransferase